MQAHATSAPKSLPQGRGGAWRRPRAGPSLAAKLARPASPSAPKKARPKSGDLVGSGRSRPAPRNLRRERGREKRKHPRERMSTQADSRKHSLGATRPEGLSGGGPHGAQPNPERSYQTSPNSHRLGGSGHPRGLAHCHTASPCCEWGSGEPPLEPDWRQLLLSAAVPRPLKQSPTHKGTVGVDIHTASLAGTWQNHCCEWN